MLLSAVDIADSDPLGWHPSVLLKTLSVSCHRKLLLAVKMALIFLSVELKC